MLRPGSSLEARALSFMHLAFLAVEAHECLAPKEKKLRQNIIVLSAEVPP